MLIQRRMDLSHVRIGRLLGLRHPGAALGIDIRRLLLHRLRECGRVAAVSHPAQNPDPGIVLGVGAGLECGLLGITATAGHAVFHCR